MSDLRNMQEFFTERAATWEDFVKNHWLPDAYEYYYTWLASPIPQTAAPIRIVDVGIGGGLEFDWIFERAPNAQVTGIDQSTAMLDCLREKFADRLHQFELIEESYLTHTFAPDAYDVAITSMSIHYFRPAVRGQIYKKIHSTLKPGGLYIEGTYCADDEEDQRVRLEHFDQITKGQPGVDEGRYKCNLPLTEATITRLKKEAGFRDITWLDNGDMVIVATK